MPHTKQSDESTPETIWSSLNSWAKSLAPWQRRIVRLASAKGSIPNEDIDAIYDLFLSARGLRDAVADVDDSAEPVIGRPGEIAKEKVTLVRVDGLAGINALPEDAELTFGPNLSVIYGRNGAGKSGFARLLANACFSRHTPDILGDIYADDPPSPAASFHIATGEGAISELIVFPDGCEGSVLKRFTVFDAMVARDHLTETAPFEFRPVGFDVFREMARTYGTLLERLDADIAARTKANTFPAAFLGGSTEVHDLINALGASTSMTRLRVLAKYGLAEAARLELLDSQIVALKAKSPKEILAGLKQAKTDIGALVKSVKTLAALFSKDAVSAREAVIVEAQETSEVAAALGSDQFQRMFFNAVGSKEWNVFVASAHALANKESESYPDKDDRCLLCERPLDEPAREHISALLRFVEGDAKQAAAKAGMVLVTEREKIAALDLAIFSDASRVRSHVQRLDPDATDSVIIAMSLFRTSQEAAVADLTALSTTAQAVYADAALEKLAALQEKIEGDIIRLESESVDSAIVSLESERRILRHREVLSQQLPAIEIFVADSAWANKATKSRSALNTRPVTDKEKELVGRIVGEGYRKRLADECASLGCEVPVELQTMGRSGQTLRSLAMSSGHQPVEVLSEGEQKVVAIADFLTEVALNPTSAGVIFDDPVNSLDYERKGRIADRLVSEAKARQVIVFTHDLVFLNQMCLAAEARAVELHGHWIDRDADGRPGSIAAGDLPNTSKVYETTKRAEDMMVKAKAVKGAEREAAIREGMGALRTTLEETVVRKVFKDIVPRWSDQVRVTALRRVNWDTEKAEEICELYEDLSRYIEGHSHTDEATGAPAEPKDLETRISKVKELIKWAKSDRPK